MPILTMALSRKAFIDRVYSHSWHIAEHLIKALVFKEQSQIEWLSQAENALNDTFNIPTENKLKSSDLDTIAKNIKITDEWAKRHIISLIDEWFDKNKLLHIAETTIYEVVCDVNDILSWQIDAVRDNLKSNKRLYSVGILTQDIYIKEMMNDYNTKEHFIIKTLSKALIKSIKKGMITI